MVICLKVKTLDSQTYDFTVDDEISVKQFKETIAEKTNISADLQRIIYCGRILSDEKLLKEYDVNGKVVHVVERPPPSSRVSTNTTESTGRRTRNNDLEGNVRGSPIFRALDGMVVGAMTIPVNATGGPQAAVPPLNPSSSFCMNRITVARHMLECANNIASYLENPERGLNNTSLDILAQGRWTMESTVVEVGISADSVEIPQNQTQNIVEALHGAVSAALRHNHVVGHPNVTVVQLPTVFSSSGAAIVSNQGGNQPVNNAVEQNSTTNDLSSDQSEQNIDEATNDSSAAGATATPTDNNASQDHRRNTSTGNSNSGSPTRQRTGTRVLAEVINQMIAVQSRLAPFINLYYDILLNDPTFEENDTTGRENAQRTFDRVSEALHYMSHAQHAISDLMLDLSQPTPRYLCCRPILVEQSGFVSANNFASLFQPNGNNNESTNGSANNTATTNISSSEAPSNVPLLFRPSAPPPQQQQQQQEQQQQQQQQQQQTQSPVTTGTIRSDTPSNPTNQSGNGGGTTGPQIQSQTQQNINRGLHRILSPLLLPMSTRSSSATSNNTTTSDNANPDNNNQANPQLQVARLIQAVVNSAPLDADLHVQINAPNLMTLLPIPLSTSSPIPQENTNSVSNSTNVTTTTGTNDARSNTNGSNQARVTTATHPTTSTQTRSTARPQVHIANIPPSQMWNTRVIPANMVSSFDRFLPCSSHHIRETETNNESEQSVYNRYRAQMRQRRQQQQNNQQQPNQNQQQQQQAPQQETSTASTPRSTSTTQPASSTRSSSTSDDSFLLNESNNILRDIADYIPSPSTLNRIRNDLHDFIVNTLFSGAPITDENMNNAINNVIQLYNDALLFLPQFDLFDYDSRASVENLIRNSLPYIINLVREDDSNEFGARLLRELINFIRRLVMIIITCIGRENAELYLNQIARMTLNSNLVPGQEALRLLQSNLMMAVIREPVVNLQNTSDVQEFLVTRRPSAQQQQQQQQEQQQQQRNEVTPMETDEQVIESSNEQIQERAIDVPSEIIAESQSPSVHKPTTMTDVKLNNESLPKVTIGSEPWHNHFPSNWLPIITRDIEKQRRQSPQNAFSDAYISGMSAKRRKLVTSSKPPTDIQSLITDGVRRAIQTVGIPVNNTSSSSSTSSNYTAEEVSTAIGTDPAAQLSYREALRSNIEGRLRTDPDFTPEKFPNSSKYFTK